MPATTTRICQIHTTPRQLREIADRMERSWAGLGCGDSTLAHTIWGDGISIEFYIDQYELGREGVA